MSAELRGIVFVAWMGDGVNHYDAHWQGDAQLDGDRILEELRPTDDLSAVMAWASSRSTKVLVRPSWDPDRYYWAGEYGSDEFERLPHA